MSEIRTIASVYCIVVKIRFILATRVKHPIFGKNYYIIFLKSILSHKQK